ncbi:homeobox protein NANOG-like [Astatotilapia calliptera]|uniref:homeobox protein NANOG-like n=2 Tax=Astatotilapia calliptera TaxID=8154 RepID=UPI000E42C2EC|nr:homeobox protein NANOG-like [Astatotilapia calliptera]
MEDYGMHFSPDLWISGSSLQGSLPLEELAAWAEAALAKEMSNNMSEAAEAVSSSVTEEELVFASPRNQEGSNTVTSTTRVKDEKAKVLKGRTRGLFSDSQLKTLDHHFNQKIYPDPQEMTELAELTGLTYKQVKTWFQNRRRKFRKIPDSHHLNQGVPLHFQGASSLSEQLDISFMRKGANNQAHYPDAVGNVVSGPQWTLHNSPQMFGWSMPPGNGHYDCNTGVLSTAWNMNDPGLHSASFYRESGEPC